MLLFRCSVPVRSRAAPVRTHSPCGTRPREPLVLAHLVYEPIEPQLCSAWRTV